MTASTHLDVQSLSAELKAELTRLSAMDCIVPHLSEFKDKDCQIWEMPAEDVLLRPSRRTGIPDRWVIASDEKVLLQEFAFYKSQNFVGSLRCIVLFLVRQDAKDVRLIARNQIGSIMMNIGCKSTPMSLTFDCI